MRPHTGESNIEGEFWEYAVLADFEVSQMQTSSDRRTRRSELLAHLFTPNGSPRQGLENHESLSSADVAVLFQMTERSIRKLAAGGRLPHMRTLGGGRLLYPPHVIAALYVEFCSNSGLGSGQTLSD